VKRATRDWLRDGARHSSRECFRDLLDSDARLRAEVRRLRGVLLKISVGPHGIDAYGECSSRQTASDALKGAK
jgi:hypothetical protein